MRLISVYIDNFGKYSDARFSFDGGLTEILKQNGDGKTTLAAFLRVMLYGMPTDKKGGKEYPIRALYNPFQGGKYGGSLEVEWQGKRYTIRRTFDQKSETKDEYVVLDERGKACDDLGDVPGMTMFGLSGDGFERTAYITWKQTKIDLQDGIGERLCGLVANTSVGYDKAKKALEDKAKTYHSDRRTAGAYTGYIPATEEEIRQKQAEIHDTEGLQVSVLALREKCKALQADVKTTSAELETMHSAELRRERWNAYQRLLVAEQESKEKADGLLAKYPKGFPDGEKVKTLKQAIKQRDGARIRLENRAFPKQAELDEKERQFAVGIPTQERLETIEVLADKAYALKPQSVAPVVVQKPKKKGAWLGLTLVAVVIAALGASLIGSMMGFGAALLAVGVLGAAVGISGLMRTPAAQVQTGASTYSQEYVEIASRLQDFFSEYGIRNSDFSAALRELKENVKTLYALRSQKEAYEQETAALQTEEQKYAETVGAIFAEYALTEETYETAALAADAYAAHCADWKKNQAAAEKYRTQYGITEEPQPVGDMDGLKAALAAAQEQERACRVQLEDAERKLENLPKLKNELSRLQETLDGYKAERALLAVAVQSLTDADKNLKDTYLVPMQTSFVRFASAMGAEWAEMVSLDENLQVQFEHKGQPRRAEHFSDGQKALVALCMRLALLENMYNGEMPFCILDDPFVHLDEKHFQEVKKGLNALAEKMQILYFTCHHSRSIID